MPRDNMPMGGAMPSPLAPEIQEAEMADEEMFQAMAPKGKFTPRGLNALVKATNSLLPLFGQTADYPMFKEEAPVLPTDFVRVLAMFSSAAEDAIAQDVLDPEMSIDMEGVMNDTGLMQLAGKIEKLAKDKSFKKFLSEPMPEQEEEAAMEEEGAPMSAEDEDALMMERM